MSAEPQMRAAHPRRWESRAANSDRDKALALVERVHTVVRGRARLRVRALYGAPSRARRVELALRAQPGIRAATASTLTATVLVHYDSSRALDDIVLALGLIALRETSRLEEPPRSVPTAKRRRIGPRGAPAPHPADGPSLRAGPPAWHALGVDRVLAELGSASGGLSAGAARERLRRGGPNALAEPAARSAAAMLLDQFRSLPVALLGLSALVSILTGALADAAAIAVVTLINATIGFTTESQVERTIASLARGSQRRALVLRDGAPEEVAACDVVPGDAVVLTPGAYVPADLRLLHARDLSVDESALTGESYPVLKHSTALDGRGLPLSARANMAYMGTFVCTGDAIGIAVATGAATEIGRVQALTSEAQAPQTPLQRELHRLGSQLGLTAGGICGLVFAVGVLRGLRPLSMVRAAISLAVAAIPEGLPTVATLSLALGVLRMRRQHALVRTLEAVETLGAVEVVCLDKTGTLTANRMAVCSLHVAGARLAVTGHCLIGLQAAARSVTEDLERLLEVAVLCNEARMSEEGPAQVLNGSATEAALLEIAAGAGVGIPELRRRYPLAGIERRAQGRNYMLTRHAGREGGMLVAVKGSPDEVLRLCHWRRQDGRLEALTSRERSAILAENERMAARGLRVLGFAYARGAATLADSRPRLVWAGLAGMADPLRAGVAALIQQLHEAGIRTVMLTGDQSATARAIGQALRLAGAREPKVVDSTEFDRLDPTLWPSMARQADIYSRVSPAHKLRIVRALQQGGRVVAMTGDGINDGPALKAADIGIAMGKSGTDLARSAADVVLEDDDLGTLVAAVSQGRTTYTNIRKAIHFLLATNLSEIELMLAAIALGLGPPLSPMQLLWINIVSDVFPALALAMEPAEAQVLKSPPRDPRERMIRRGDLARYGLEATLMTAGALASYGFGLLRHGPGARARGLSFMTLSLGQLAHAYACRSDSHGLLAPQGPPRNAWLDLAVAGTAAAQLGALFVPGLRRLLGLTRLDALDLVVVSGGAVLPLLANEALKASRARAAPGRPTAGRTAARRGGHD